MKAYLMLLLLALAMFSCDEEMDFALSSTDEVSLVESETVLCGHSYESPATFRYGWDSLSSYVQSRKPVFKACFSGAVYIQFVIDENGKVRNETVIRGFGEPYDSLVLQRVLPLPDFVPSKIDGIAVSSRMIIPVTYRDYED